MSSSSRQRAAHKHDKQRQRSFELARRQKAYLNPERVTARRSEGPLKYHSYDITYGPISEDSGGASEVIAALGSEGYDALHDQVKTAPEAAIERLTELTKAHPGVGVLYNWLTAAYIGAGRFNDAERVAGLNYHLNPNYLFARLNYAQIAMQNDDVEKVATILDQKFDLKLLYPHRKVFHVSEFVAFCGLVIQYWVRTDEHEAAQALLDVLEEVAPDEPQTKAMGSLVENAILLKALGRIAASGLFGRRRSKK